MIKQNEINMTLKISNKKKYNVIALERIIHLMP